MAAITRKLTIDEKWAIANAMFEEMGLVRQHLDSFNDFIQKGLLQIIKEEEKIELELPPEVTQYYVRLDDITVKEPTVREADGSFTNVKPMEARIRNLTYAGELILKMTPVFIDEDGHESEGEPEEVRIGYLPIMLKSVKCPLSRSKGDSKELQEDPRDPGGYFIINGSERVIVTQEDLAPNRILTEKLDGKSSVTALAKVFSTKQGFRAPVTLELNKDGTLRVSFPSVSRKIPLVVLLKALGMEKDRDITIQIAGNDAELRKSLFPALQAEPEVRTTEDALDYIGKRIAVGQSKEYRLERTKQVLDKYLLPHIGDNEEERIEKARYLCQMATRVLELHLGRREEDDKDHYANKRLNLAGDLLMQLFRNAFRALTRDIKYQLERNSGRGRTPSLKTAVRADVITERLRHALATGNWSGGKAGVSQLLDRTNYMSALSHLRRVVSPLSRSQPHFEARDLHPTHWGKICVAPDSKVLLDDGFSVVPIHSLRSRYEQTKVITVDPETKQEVPSELTAFQTISAKELGKRVFEIRTITGRSIIATEDHPFLTTRGWVEAGDLTPKDQVLVRPILEKIEEENENNDVASFEIISEEDFLAANQDLVRDETLLQQDIVELRKLGLLPLDSDNEKLPIIARLIGLVITDGRVEKSTVEFYARSRTDVEAIKRDLQRLGFHPSIFKEKTTSVGETKDRTHVTTINGAFSRLLKALGIPQGKRIDIPYDIPWWLKSCSKLVKREFLGGIMGGNGTAPWLYQRSGRESNYKIRTPHFEIHKNSALTESLVQFMDSLKSMFEELGIRINNIHVRTLENQSQVKAQMLFDGSRRNIKALCERIGYRYCAEKQHKAQLIQEYLAYRENEVQKQTMLGEKIIQLYELSSQPNEITEYLDEKHRVVTSTIQKRNDGYSVIPSKSSLNPEQFLELTRASLETGMLYEPIVSIQETDHDIVMDFTTKENTHSFIANGFVTHNCPNETPEGPNCGLVKNLALQAHICTGVDEKIIEEFCENAGVFQGERTSVGKEVASVFLNGRLIGFHQNPEILVEQIRLNRRRQRLPSEVNVAYYPDVQEVQINSDHGRVRRPLIIVKDGRPLLKENHLEKIKKGELGWQDLIRQGVIEYLDAEEEENAYIALSLDQVTEEHTHVEIEPSTILGITASLIPFPEHNRSDRNVYEAGMAKQALGIYAANFRLRMDTRGHVLHYPQIPLVKTHAMKTIGFDDRPAGQNFVVALLSYGGYNMEDALIFNQASIDRGLGRSTFFRSYESEERKYPGGQEDRFEVPSEDARGYKNPKVYRHLAEDGIVEPEAEVDGNKGEVIIGRTSPPRFIEEYQDFDMPMQFERRRETSVSMRFGETGVADLVVITETQEGNKLVKVKMRSLRIPEVGDKFASRHGQKGVIGYIAKQEDMPFSEDGIVPDLIINPHAIPSRMTIGQLLELLSGLLASEQGKPVYATAFEGISSDDLISSLKEHGLQPYGRRVMYDGRTGEKLEAEVFVGIAFYQKLHHLVNDKIHARARGPVQILTRQPTEGRAREGGLKFGEMERDCLIGHGSAIILKERLLDESDKSEILVCERCGFLAYYNRNKDKMECPICRDEVNVSKITISYAFKLLVQELMSLGIAPKIELTSLA